MPATTGGRPTSKSRGRSNYRKPKVKAKPFTLPDTPQEKFVAPAPKTRTTRGMRRSGTSPAAPGRAPAKRVGGAKKRAEQERNAAEFRQRTTRSNRRIRRAKKAERAWVRRQRLYRFTGSPGPFTDLQRAEVDAYKQTPTYKRAQADAKDISESRRLRKDSIPGLTEKQTLAAVKADTYGGFEKLAKPAADVLNETTRAAEFLAGAEVSALKDIKKGRTPNPIKAIKAGWESGGSRKNTKRGKDVLKELGVPKGTVRKIAGGAIDIVADPVTYVPVGGVASRLSAASRATRAGAKAGRRAGRPTTGKRVMEEVSSTSKRRARSRRPVPKTSAARKVERRKRSAATRQAWTRSATRSASVGVKKHQPSQRSTVAKLFPVRPAEISPQEWRKLEDASRRMRGTERSEALRAARKARSIRHVAKGERGRRRVLLRKPMKKEQSDRIRVAIERQKVHELPKHERRAAERFQAETERQLAMKRRAAQDAGERGPKQAKDGPVARYRPREPEGDIYYHGTDAKTAAEITKNGGFTGRRRNSVWAARGEELTKHYGDTTVKVSVKPEKPLDVDGPEYPILAYGATASEIEQRARQAGYDAIVRRGDDGWIKALRPSIVKTMQDEPTGYVPRVHTESLPSRGPAARQIRRRLKRTGEDIGPGRERSGIRIGKRRTTTVKDKMRTDRRHWDELDEPAYVSDLETTLMAAGQKAANFKATTEYRAAVRSLGRPARNNAQVPPGHSVWVVKSTKGERRFEQVPKGEPVPRDAIVLKDSIANHANQRMLRREPLPFIDSTTNKIKWWLTIPNPQYWMRNAYGGLFNVWGEGTPARKILANIPGAARTTRQLGRAYRAEELAKKPPWVIDKGKTRVVERGTPREREIRELGERHIDLGKAGRMRVRDFFQEIEDYNVAGGGQIQELIGAESMPRRSAQFFEDLPRMTAYLYFRRQGLDPASASRKVQRSQFDYGNLTEFEKNVMRRIFPFYTWRSRNLALQAESLLARPGKYATTEKIRDTAADLSDMPEDWQEKLTKSEAFGLPFPTPLKLNDKKQLLYPALPLTDLNLTTGLGKGDIDLLLEQLIGSTNPIVKWPVEFITNYSFYFKDDIEQDYSRWVKAPQYAVKAYERTPEPLRKLFRMDEVIKQDPKEGWQWRGKADYLANAIPPAAMATGLLTQGETGRGTKKEQKAFGYLTGIRPAPFQPGKNRLNRLYDRKEELEAERSDLSELNQEKKLGTNRYTARKAKLENEITQLEWAIYDLGRKLDTSPSEPARSRDKRYFQGYDPENPPDTRLERDTAPLWGDDAPVSPTKKQRKARKRQSRPDTAPLW